VRRLALAAALTILLAVASAAYAAPSLIGPTGMLVVPTAEVLGMTQWNVGATAVRADDASDETVYYANLVCWPVLDSVGLTLASLDGFDDLAASVSASSPW